MKNLTCFALCLLALSGCASRNHLAKSVWFNTTPSEKGGEKGVVFTNLYFTSDHNVDIYSSVKSDTALIVKPFLWAKGTYSVTKGVKRRQNLSIKAISLRNDEVNYAGFYQKDKTMILISDSLAGAFVKMPHVKLP